MTITYVYKLEAKCTTLKIILTHKNFTKKILQFLNEQEFTLTSLVIQKAEDDLDLGCKPFQDKFLEIEILCSSDSVFSPDSKYGFQKS